MDVRKEEEVFKHDNENEQIRNTQEEEEEEVIEAFSIEYKRDM